jgi:shikimate kinase
MTGPEKILLSGFMGAGKTFLVKSWAAESAPYICLDLDEELLKRHGLGHFCAGSLLRTVGEKYFREIEAETIEALLARPERMVIALGGGALTEENVQRWNSEPKFLLVWVKVPLEICLQRTHKSGEDRPLLDSDDEEIRQLFISRTRLYSKAGKILENSGPPIGWNQENFF